MQESDFEEKRILFLCYLILLKRTSPTLIQDWWKKETQSRLLVFLELLGECLNVFEFVEEEKWKEKINGIKFRKADETKLLLQTYYQTVTPQKMGRIGSRDRVSSLRINRNKLVGRRSRDDIGLRKIPDSPESRNSNSWRMNRPNSFIYNPTTVTKYIYFLSVLKLLFS